MKERIEKNEERLDKALTSIKELERALENFESNKKSIDLLNKYYGSKGWFKDKEDYENKKIDNRIKAGVLSEDAVWNMNDDIKDIMCKMDRVKKLFCRNK